jgi:hypothetical protein
MLDTVHVPYWKGSGPYPSVKVRMDFRGSIVGQFVYHCHIMSHEDFGMMAIIQVNPAASLQEVVDVTVQGTPISPTAINTSMDELKVSENRLVEQATRHVLR